MRFVHADKPDFPVQYDINDSVATHYRYEKQRAYMETLFEPPVIDGLDVHQEWIVPDFIPLGTLAILAGDPKSGKTCLATALALAVATGTPFAGMPTCQTGVLWMACEESRRERHFILKDSPLLDADTPLYTCYQYFPIDTDEGLYYLTHWIREVDARFIVVDPLYGAISGRSMGEAWNARKTLMPLKEFAGMMKVTILVLHHTKQPKHGSFDRRVAESAQLSATAGMEMVLSSRQSTMSENDRLITLVCKGRGEFANRRLQLLSRAPLDYRTVDQPVLPNPTPRPPLYLQRIMEALRSGPKTSEELADDLRVETRVLRNGITALRREGLVASSGKQDRANIWALTELAPQNDE